jgi:hypothetical protein
MAAYKDEDEYEFSHCVDTAIAAYYPDTLTPAHPFFKRYMIELQIAMLACHLPIMSGADKRRAKTTVATLKGKLGRLSAGNP